MASQIGVEPTTFRLGGDCILQLCYEDISYLILSLFGHSLITLRRRMLYPTELQRQFSIQFLTLFGHSLITLRRRTLYPTELQRQFSIQFLSLFGHSLLTLRRPIIHSFQSSLVSVVSLKNDKQKTF